MPGFFACVGRIESHLSRTGLKVLDGGQGVGVYRVDLTWGVSKPIGEMGKNLDRLSEKATITIAVMAQFHAQGGGPRDPNA